MKKFILLVIVLISYACQANVSEKKEETEKPVAMNLKDGLKSFFWMGTAISNAALTGEAAEDLDFIPTQFNAVTAENAMKWQYIQPKEGVFDWKMSDRFVDYATKQKMHVTGHVLIWHQQTPNWVFKDKSGKLASKKLLFKRIETHIKKYVERYKGKIHSWDVVNEALNDDGTYRQSDWFKILGEDFIVKAFELAHKYDPDAELIYNDYNLFKPEKRAGAVRIVKMLQDKDIPIHAVGMQGHYGLGYPENLQEIEESIKTFSALGVKVHISELDISVLPFPEAENQGADISLNVELRKELNPYPEKMPADVVAIFNKQYLDIFKILIKHKNVVERVTLWGLNDGDSWRNDWPVKGRTDYPLLIDRNNNLKPAAKEIIEYGINKHSILPQ